MVVERGGRGWGAVDDERTRRVFVVRDAWRRLLDTVVEMGE
jgi:hypothetical protein